MNPRNPNCFIVLCTIFLVCAMPFFVADRVRGDLIEVDVILAHPTTEEERSLIDADIAIDTTAIDAVETLPTVAPPGTVPVSTVKNRIYNTLLVMKQLEFSRSIPWTDQTLYNWFISSCQKMTFVTNSAYSYAIPANHEIVIALNPNTYLLSTDSWISESYGGGLADTVILYVHEARHLNDYYHTWGSNDATLQELGAWSVQYYVDRLLANYSNVTNANMSYTSSTLNGYADSVLTTRIADTNLAVTIAVIDYSGTNATIAFSSPQPYSQHELYQSEDLQTWQAVPSASFQQAGLDQVLGFTDSETNRMFYRLMLIGL